MGNGNKIDFVAYCTAFKALEPKMAEEICQTLDRSEEFWTGYMYQGEKGDGYVLIPSYKNIMGERQIDSWRQLYQDGTVYTGTGGDAYRSDGIDATAAPYFIAGAFGIEELSGNVSDMDKAVIAGIKKLYRQCAAEGEACLDSTAAKELGQRWSGMLEERGELYRLSGEIRTLSSKLASIEEGAIDKAGLEKRLSAYRDNVKEKPATSAEAREAVESLNAMISLSEAFVAEEKRVASAAKELQDLRNEITKAWATANEILDWVKENDKWHNKITPQDIIPIISRNIYLKDANPQTMDEARRYAEQARVMLAEIAGTHSGIEAIKKKGFGLETCASYSEYDDCDEGSRSRTHYNCTIISGVEYEYTSKWENHGCRNKPVQNERVRVDWR